MIQKPVQYWSDRLLSHLLELKEKDPGLVFWLRQRNATKSKEKRLENGHWFQGDDSYISIGFYRVPTGDQSTQSVSFKVGVSNFEYVDWAVVDIIFKNHDPELLKFYDRCLEEIPGFEKQADNHYKLFFGDGKDVFKHLSVAFGPIKSQMDQIKKELEMEELLDIDPVKFDRWLTRTLNIREDIKKNGYKSQQSYKSLNGSYTGSEIPLNQILYGPPGTGKTYETRAAAVGICDPDFRQIDDRALLKEKYEELQKDGRIAFLTFHQSFTYEDFVEGIKPKTKNDRVRYIIEDGLFKNISERSLLSTVHVQFEGESSETRTFDEVYSEYVKSIKPQEGTDKTVATTISGNEVILLEVGSESLAVRFRWYDQKQKVEATSRLSITKKKLKMLYEGGMIPEEVKSLKEAFKPYFTYHQSIYFAVYKSFYEFVEEHIKGEVSILDTEKVEFEDLLEAWDELSEKQEIEKYRQKPYVLIIDEINRGNISQIFGELITLLEPDKRIGEDEELRVSLPYSKASFGVPSNLYIIGTMNTADRSVEALDTALRRRFTFKEIAPKPELLSSASLIWHLWWKFEKTEFWEDNNYKTAETALYDLIGRPEQLEQEKYDIWARWKEQGRRKKEQIGELERYEFALINLKDLLLTINDRIEQLLDKDHTIGHSYFFSLIGAKDGKTELLSIFYNEIIPLLQEYFYGNFGLIGLVLGRHFITSQSNGRKNASDIFADFVFEDKYSIAQKKVYKIIDYRIEEEEEGKLPDFIAAVQSIYKQRAAEQRSPDEGMNQDQE